MDNLEDDLDLRYHRGVQPDVYYRCPTLESMDGALRNELEKNASSLIPVEVVTEFIFATTSTITIPVAQQPALEALIQPANHLQSIEVGHTLCRDIDGKERLKLQRAIAKSIIEAVQAADGFKYSERSAHNKEGGDGARVKYVCQDSLQNRHRKGNTKKEKDRNGENHGQSESKGSHSSLPTYDCGGALFVKFSIKREAINVVYKHNPIHSRPVNSESNLPPLPVETDSKPRVPKQKVANGAKERKRERNKKDPVIEDNAYADPFLHLLTSPDASKPSARKRSKKSAASTSPESSCIVSAKKRKTAKENLSPVVAQEKVQTKEPPPPSKPIGRKSCIRCREKKVKCDKAIPSCNQCRRGIWICQYEPPGAKKRSKGGCVNYKTRNRNYAEERSSCARCPRVDDECDYGDFP